MMEEIADDKWPDQSNLNYCYHYPHQDKWSENNDEDDEQIDSQVCRAMEFGGWWNGLIFNPHHINRLFDRRMQLNGTILKTPGSVKKPNVDSSQMSYGKNCRTKEESATALRDTHSPSSFLTFIVTALVLMMNDGNNSLQRVEASLGLKQQLDLDTVDRSSSGIDDHFETSETLVVEILLNDFSRVDSQHRTVSEPIRRLQNDNDKAPFSHSPLKMYGLYLEAVNDYINESYGEDVWRLIEARAEIPHLKFVRHQMYNFCFPCFCVSLLTGNRVYSLYCSDNLILRLAKAAGEVLGKTHDELMYAFGVYMVKRIGNYGYERILKVLGRNVRDFINELDNLHEYFRFSFPKVQPPSFCVEEECETSLTLHYRSTRKGFTQFVKGQLSQVGRQFYNTDIEVEILSKEETEKMTYVVYKMNFDNAAFKHRMPQQKTAPGYEKLPMKRGIFFDMFPFSVIFRRDMTMYRIGDGLKEVFSDLQGKKFNEEFTLVRPMLEFSWDNIYTHLNNVFELLSKAVVESKQKMNLPKLSKKEGEEAEEKEESEKPKKEERELKALEEMKGADKEYSNALTPYNSTANTGAEDIELLAFQTVTGKCSETIFEDMREPPKKPLHLKGQMKYVPQWDSLIFLGTPIIETVEDMIKMGVYVNDLNLHDSSRELILAGTQQSAELQLALDQEQQKYAQLQEIIKKLDEEKKRGDSLLYAMIPKAVADRLRKGITALETCQVFPDVTILFSDVVKFNEICIHITPMQVVDMLNEIYIVFDTLSEKHNVYKVETIRDAYMVVAGVPNKTTFHAHHICDMALDMLSSIDHLKDPSTGDNIQIRVGIHSGMVVAGVVGLKMPRYCLFGDTVNTASRMESNGVGMQIHISQTTKDHLEHEPYIIEERGKIFVKVAVAIFNKQLLEILQNVPFIFSFELS
ncbi:soluble guanylate cyclase 88E-like [Erpetoichthys calabaricus]|uniref:soluble guanylate cyclase 88E-like n=1 Tax=Erpetoichthys calabaricus TaxID=27687 RepID=UPI0022345FEF|nr:soluble guanylate cyclase 88E-like [Erpetoichthys calabaricus]